MPFRISGLDPETFAEFRTMPEAELALRGIRRMSVDSTPGFPDRIELRDMVPGETALLLNFEHQPAQSPDRSRHAIFINPDATKRRAYVDDVPDALRIRLLSLRAFNADGDIVDADVVEGRDLEPLIERLLADPRTAYIHAHFAKRGCFAARIDRI